MKERPILFSAPMVVALLAGRKTQTRRVLKQPLKRGVLSADGWRPFDPEREGDHASMSLHSPYGSAGDRLWVRETWGLLDTQPKDGPEKATVFYRSTDGDKHEHRHQLWRPSIFMPRWASRLTLEVTSVRVERLNDISEADAISEGLEPFRSLSDQWTWPGSGVAYSSAVRAYLCGWDTINGEGAASRNPWVWVVSFQPASFEADQ